MDSISLTVGCGSGNSITEVKVSQPAHALHACRYSKSHPCAPAFLRFILIVLTVVSALGSSLCVGEVKISGVPDYQQDDFEGENDCTPVASADVLGYWDANGYGDLIDGSNDYATNPVGVTALVDALKTYMWWTSAGTDVGMINPGIKATFTEQGYSFSVANDYSVSWSDVKTEVDAGRPAVFTFNHATYVILHSGGAIGYDEPDDTKIIIIHDNWYPANDVHLNFDECTGTVLTTVAPGVPRETRVVIVQGMPPIGMPITVSPPDNDGKGDGTTEFIRTYYLEASVSLTAPEVFAGDTDYAFVMWVLDWMPLPGDQRSLQITMDTDHYAVAIYEPAPPSKITDLTAEVVDAEEPSDGQDDAHGTERKAVQLTWTAPGTGNGGTTGKAASYEVRYSLEEMTTEAIWDAATEIDGEPEPEPAGTIQSMTISLDALPVEAQVYYFAITSRNDSGKESDLSSSPFVDTRVWPIPGDTNFDCRINIIDLIFVRNRLQQDPTTSNNWQVDVNKDGAINIIDLIFVRNYLGAYCQ